MEDLCKKVAWTNDFKIGIEKIDLQHQTLINVVNNLIDQPLPETTSQKISDVLDKMTKYAKLYFKTEEEIMFKYGFPNLNKHKNEHLEFIKKTVNLCFATSLDVEDVPRVLVRYLRDWIIEHILACDMEYKKFFEEKNICCVNCLDF